MPLPLSLLLIATFLLGPGWESLARASGPHTNGKELATRTLAPGFEEGILAQVRTTGDVRILRARDKRVRIRPLLSPAFAAFWQLPLLGRRPDQINRQQGFSKLDRRSALPDCRRAPPILQPV